MPQKGFSEASGWVILSPIEARIKEKIEAVGVPLRDWDIKIYRGILTGYNEAFIINEETKNKLIAASPKNVEIIRPILLGKNIKRYSYTWEGTWLINSHNGIRSKNIDAIDLKKNYPVVLEYLQAFQPNISLRADQGNHWSNLRNCAYLEEFDKPKIAWGNLAINPQFAFVEQPMIINNPANFITTDNLYILAVLNSALSKLYIKQLGVSRNGGYMEYKPMFVGLVPIPPIAIEQQNDIVEIVNKLLRTKNEDERREFEQTIDNKVCGLYGLNMEEISYILSI